MRRYFLAFAFLLSGIGTSAAQPFTWTGFYVGVSGGYGWSDGGADNRLTTSFGTDQTDNTGLSPSSVGGDIRFSRPLANNIGVSGGLWARSFLGDEARIGYDLHPTPDADSFLKVAREWFLMPYIGLTYWCPSPSFLRGDPSGNTYGVDNIAWTAYAGYRYERSTLRFTTDESGGGGDMNTFSRSENYWAPTLGLDADINLRRNVGPINFVRVGAAYDFGKDLDLSGTSTLGLDYLNRVEIEGSWRVYAEIGYRFRAN